MSIAWQHFSFKFFPAEVFIFTVHNLENILQFFICFGNALKRQSRPLYIIYRIPLSIGQIFLSVFKLGQTVFLEFSSRKLIK